MNKPKHSYCLLQKIKKMKYLIFLLILTLFAGCSFDSRTGIWSGSEEEKRRISALERELERKINTVQLYSTENIYSKEIPAVKNVSLTEPIKNLSWEMSGLNIQNFTGNLYLPSIKKKFLLKLRLEFCKLN